MSKDLKSVSAFSLEYLANLKKNTPFFLFSKEKVLKNFENFKNSMPKNTEICYAMKANSERPLLETLHQHGASFEVASKYELGFLKPLKVSAKNVIFGTAVKPISHIKEFVSYGVDRFAFDSEEELRKLSRFAPGSRVYVRVLVDDRSDSVFHMSQKFGAELKRGTELLIKAKDLGLIPYGISFNVGSQARSEFAWARGISDVSSAMSLLQKKNVKIQVINFGGGFPFSYQDGDNIPSIEKISKHVKEAIKGLPYQVNFIAEPGRNLVANAFVLVVSVFAKSKRNNGTWLFVDAGVYNAVLEALASQGSTKYRIRPLKKYRDSAQETYILTGPTGDNLDVINKEIILPSQIQSGDRIAIFDVGAYSFTLMTRFNGFPKPKVYFIK